VNRVAARVESGRWGRGGGAGGGGVSKRFRVVRPRDDDRPRLKYIVYSEVTGKTGLVTTTIPLFFFLMIFNVT